MIETQYLDAGFERIGYSLTIGYFGAGTKDNPQEGDKRIYLDNDELKIQKYVNGAWAELNSIRIGGSYNSGTLYPFIHSNGLYHTSLEKEVGFNGIPVSANEMFLFSLENNFQDQNGNDPFTNKSGTYTFDSNSKYGNYGLKVSNGDWAIIATGSQYKGLVENSSLSMGGWFYNENPDGATYNNITLREINNGSTYHILEVQGTVARYKIYFGGWILKIEKTVDFSQGFVFLACGRDASTDTHYLVVNNEIIYGSISAAITGTDGLELQLKPSVQYSTAGNTYTDEVFIIPNKYVEPENFVDYYDSNKNWDFTQSKKT